jgi:iron complex transport system substrate-binding protein
VIATAGGFNLGSDLNGAYAQISIEEIIQVNPDVILLGDAVWGGVTPEIVTARAGWDGLKAVQAQQIFPFDDNLVSRPGPRLIDGVEEMARLLHPGVLE